MPKRPSPNLIKKHRVYTPWEASDALGVHRQTIHRWIEDKGLIADKARKPWLIMGGDLKSFLGERRAAGKCKLSMHHIYCFGCKSPQMPDGRIADYKHQTKVTGMLTGLCPDCGAVMNKVICRADLEAIRAKIDVTVQQADPTLVCRELPPLTATLAYGAQTHVKAHFK
jgi:excisionase family DNA binding protein